VRPPSCQRSEACRFAAHGFTCVTPRTARRVGARARPPVSRVEARASTPANRGGASVPPLAEDPAGTPTAAAASREEAQSSSPPAQGGGRPQRRTQDLRLFPRRRRRTSGRRGDGPEQGTCSRWTTVSGEVSAGSTPMRAVHCRGDEGKGVGHWRSLRQGGDHERPRCCHRRRRRRCPLCSALENSRSLLVVDRGSEQGRCGCRRAGL
jgi:hypothetical protein